MEFNDYQVKANGTSLNTKVCGDNVLYPVLGLSGEAGEIAEKFKKQFRDRGGEYTDEFKTELVKELGDVMWYVAEISTQLGIDLEVVAQRNIEKLYSRKERNQIQGSGDNR